MSANPCDACGGSSFRVLYPDHPILDGPLVECEQCRLVQVNPPGRRYQIADVATRETRAGAYARQNAAVQATLQYRPEVEHAERAVRERFWLERLARIERAAPTGSLLEIGSDGQFLRLAATRGWTVTGLQPDANACASAAKLYGVELRPTTLHEARFPDGSFDVVTMFHVLEHVPSPRALCAEVLRVLRPGGRLFAETPNVATLWFRVLGARWRQFIPDHYWFFSPDTLRALLTDLGYVVENIDSVGKAVSLRLVLNRVERMAHRPLPALATLLERLRVSDRIVWLRPGDIMLATARR